MSGISASVTAGLDLHALAAMPAFGAAAAIIRKSVDPLWGLYDSGEAPTRWRCTVEFTRRETVVEVIEVEAATKDAAEAEAKRIYKDEFADWDSELEGISAELIEEGEA